MQKKGLVPNDGHTDMVATLGDDAPDISIVLVVLAAEVIVFIDYLQKGLTINGEYYANLLSLLRESVKTKLPEHLTKGVLWT